MFEEYKYKTELHTHTSPASGCSKISPDTLTDVYKREGYTSVALTNHFIVSNEDPKSKIERYLDDYYKTKELGRKKGINIILGAEIRFSENINDYLVYGIDEKELFTINSLLDDGIVNFYKSYKNDRNIIIQAHPFRVNMSFANPEYIDGIEAFNMHPSHNSRIGLAAQYAKRLGCIVTAGTDFHDYGYEGLSAILTKEPVTDSYMLADVLKSRDYLMEISGFRFLPY